MNTIIAQKINELINKYDIIIFMKGSREQPLCGFSNTVVQIMNNLSIPYHTVNILEDTQMRQGIKEYSNWPTIPQVYIRGKFIGGSDILIEQYQNKKLHEMVEIIKGSL
uniref:Glutaredoxin n=1 Tax=Acrochaetium secundatum TaxID=209631 RepID=A0A4D6BKH5_9FLOR|nr:Glutaredoxin [Acrochaetium secundatum]QBX88516.1 Glutaredoxin [Acrochaetium secundatum]